MSNELAKSEVDCAVAPYSHHHHHHHHHLPPHQNPHLQHHHNPHLVHHHLVGDVSPPHSNGKLVSSSNVEDVENELHLADTNVLIDDHQHRVQFECDEDQISGLTRLVTRTDSLLIVNNEKHLTQLETVVSHTNFDQRTTIGLSDHSDDSVSPQSESSSGNSDISNSGDDEDSEGDDDDDEEEEDEVDEDDKDSEEGEDDDYDDEEIEDDTEDDIVDPGVNQSLEQSHSRVTNDSHGYECSGTNFICYDRLSNNLESTNVVGGQEDAIFEEEEEDDDDEEPTQVHNASNQDLLDSERMLEVTRKLVRSTERDPDRDLRKQVLLRTAIRKLPHFMEYNQYSDSFDQSFQMHNNSMDGNNTPVNCMSPAQYYEHNHLNHLNMEQQPKSYYHSVQPNAIQISTTSLRMLDLNDDNETEHAITSLEPKIQSFVDHTDLNASGTQMGLEQRTDYANHQIYNQHYGSMDSQQTNPLQSHSNREAAIHDFSQYENQDSNTGMIVRHSTLNNLYQPLDSSDMNDESKPIEQATAFHTACEYSQVAPVDYEVVTSDGLIDDKSDINDNLMNVPPQQINVSKSDQDDVIAISHHSDDLHQQQEHDCNQNRTSTTAFHDKNETRQDTLDIDTTDLASPTLVANVTNLEETLDDLRSGHHSALSEGNSSNSSQSSTASDDSVNSTSSQSNDSGGALNGISILETSLNSSTEYRFNQSHDSGVSLFSPRSNKRSSSTIGLDDEMEIDHLTDLTSSNQFNSSGSLSSQNQCKRMRKREIMD